MFERVLMLTPNIGSSALGNISMGRCFWEKIPIRTSPRNNIEMRTLLFIMVFMTSFYQ